MSRAPDQRPSPLPEWLPTPARIASFFWAAKIVFAERGLPDTELYFNGGIGDDVMCSVVACELQKRKPQKIWQFTKHPGIFAHNPDVVAVSADFRLRRLCDLFGAPCIELEYPHPPPSHLITTICAAAGIRGEVELCPNITLIDAEKESNAVTKRPQIAIQTSSLGAQYPMLNKQWPAERFQIVVDGLADQFDFVQVGAQSDPPLRGVIDFRGKTTLRETAAILSASRLFIGLASGVMHMARAVECRSVIIFGGREHPAQSGYSANENLYWDGACSPCWQRNHCDYDRRCMDDIRPDAVIAAVKRQAERYGTPLAIDRAII